MERGLKYQIDNVDKHEIESAMIHLDSYGCKCFQCTGIASSSHGDRSTIDEGAYDNDSDDTVEHIVHIDDGLNIEVINDMNLTAAKENEFGVSSNAHDMSMEVYNKDDIAINLEDINDEYYTSNREEESVGIVIDKDVITDVEDNGSNDIYIDIEV